MPFQIDFKGYPTSNGPIQVGKVPWDSARYGFPFYEVHLVKDDRAAVVSAITSWKSSFTKNDRAVLVTRVVPADVSTIELLNKLGFYYVETAITLTMPLKGFETYETPGRELSILRRAEKEDLPEIKTMAAFIFHTDRFHIDPRLPKQRADERFANWVDDSFESGDEIWISISRETHKIIAWVIMRPCMPSVVISLGAVDPAEQSRSQSRITIGDSLATFRDRGFEKVSINVSLNNTSIIRSVVGLGFNFGSAEHIFHCHLGSDDEQ